MAVTPYRQQTRVPGPRLGRDMQAPSFSGLAEIGDAMARLGDDLARRDDAIRLNEARRRMVEGFGGIERDLVEDMDHETMRERVGERVAAVREQAFDDGLSESARARLGLEFERERQTAMIRADRRAFALRGGAARAGLAENLNALAERAGLAEDPAVVDRLRVEAARTIATARTGGYLSAEQAQAEADRFDVLLSRNAAERLMVLNPARAVEVFSEPGALDLNEADRIRFLDTAQRRAEAERNRAEAGLGREVDVAVSALLNGYPVEPERLAALTARAEGTEHAGRLAAVAEAARFRDRDFYAMSAAERAAALREIQGGVATREDLRVAAMFERLDGALTRAEADEAATADRALRDDVAFAVDQLMGGVEPPDLGALRERAAGTPYAEVLGRADLYASELSDQFADDPAGRADAVRRFREGGASDALDMEMMRQLSAIDQNARKLAESDAVAYGQRAGLIDAEPLDLGDADAVAARIAAAEAVAEREGVAPRYFSKAEADNLSETIRGGSVDDRLALATSIVADFGGRAHDAFEELSGADPVFAHAGHLVAMTGAREAAATILRGAEARAAGGAPDLSADSRRAVMAGAVGPALDAAPPALRATIEEAARAYYAARAPSRVSDGATTGDDAEALFEEALQAAAGQVDAGGRKLGGFQAVFDHSVLLPPALDAAAAEAAVEAARWFDLESASVFGGRPMDGPEPVDPAALSGAVLRARPGGSYIVGLPTAAGVRWLTDPFAPNGLYHLDLEALARETAGRRPRIDYAPQDMEWSR